MADMYRQLRALRAWRSRRFGSVAAPPVADVAAVARQDKYHAAEDVLRLTALAMPRWANCAHFKFLVAHETHSFPTPTVLLRAPCCTEGTTPPTNYPDMDANCVRFKSPGNGQRNMPAPNPSSCSESGTQPRYPEVDANRVHFGDAF